MTSIFLVETFEMSIRIWSWRSFCYLYKRLHAFGIGDEAFDLRVTINILDHVPT